ncbi:hypothetical protein V5E97_06925 [Singulisphaera sp. Ch08]|uniref:Uncharacterized protein n=1 Tax=Singulisphaera sp. Ch08 TaxID=3120278 RepID=A0AAU7CJR8_9BACT
MNLGAGMVLEANGTINSGVNMQAAHATGMIDTNDPDLGSKLAIGDNCPNDPSDPDLQDADKPTDQAAWLIIGAAILIVIILKK